jgi:hypothetical protein
VTGDEPLIVQPDEPFVIPLDATGQAQLAIGPDDANGWAIYRGPEVPGTFRLFVRLGFGVGFDQDQRPPVVITEILCALAEGIGATVLRSLPLARIEVSVRRPRYYDAVRERLTRGAGANTAFVPFPWPEESITWWFANGAPEPGDTPKLKLWVPPGRPKPDLFYLQVATVFTALSTVTRRPSPELAEANGVPVTTIHGWVKEARRRGFLPSGQRSRGRGE